MRIVVLSLLLIALLLPGFRAEAVAPPAASLHPTGVGAGVSGVASYTDRAGQLTLHLDVGGLTPKPVLGASAARGVYVVWLVDVERRLMNAGVLTPSESGTASANFGPFSLSPTGLIVAVSAEPRPDVAAPTAPSATVVLSGQFPREQTRTVGRLSAYLGPDWFAPVLPAALGLTLLRQAGRSRRPTPR